MHTPELYKSKVQVKQAEDRLTGMDRHGTQRWTFVCDEKMLATTTVPKNNMGKGLPKIFWPQYVFGIHFALTQIVALNTPPREDTNAQGKKLSLPFK